MDVKDTRLLYELEHNARQSNSEIGKKIGLSKENVKYRKERLEKKGIIQRYSTIIDFFKVGLHKFKLYIRFRNTNQEKLKEICDYFFHHKKTESLIIGFGKWDLNVNFIVKNELEFDQEILKVMEFYSEFIHEKATATTLYVSHATRDWLGNKDIILKENIQYKLSTEIEKIDEIDDRILRLLVNNANMFVRDIAKITNTTPRVVQHRMKILEKKGVILTYRAIINPSKLGKTFSKIFFFLGNLTPKKLDEFINYCHNIKQSLWPQRLLASWDAELDLEFENNEELEKILAGFKEKFSDILINYELFLISKELKLDFYPNADRVYEKNETQNKHRRINI